jgi:hypothetical protein
MNKTQKIIIKEIFCLGLAFPSELSITFEYILPAIKEAGFSSIFGSLGNVFLFIFNFLLIYASYGWIMNIAYNLDMTSRILSPERFNWFLFKLSITFIITFILVLIIKTRLGL